MLKAEARILGIDDSPFDKFTDKKTLIIGTFFRGGLALDGVMSTYAAVDGSDATTKIIAMIKKSKFLKQLQVIMLNGIAVGGFNVVDIQRLNKSTGIPVIVVMRDMPDVEKIKLLLKKLGMAGKVKLIERAGEIHKIGSVRVQLAGCTPAKAREFLKLTSTRSLIPEPVRIAHLIAAGIKLGESKGRA
jgi:uncharacterized protein